MTPSCVLVSRGLKQMRLVLLGARGSGKGTQAARLREHLQVPHVSTGELLRAAVAAGTALGRQAKAVMESGALVSDEIVRSEEHTSELQSPCNLVCRLLLEKKKK